MVSFLFKINPSFESQRRYRETLGVPTGRLFFVFCQEYSNPPKKRIDQCFQDDIRVCLKIGYIPNEIAI